MANTVPRLHRLSLLGGTEETDWGTPATVSAPFTATSIWDAMIAAQDQFAQGERAPMGTYIGQVAAVAGKKVGVLTFRSQVRTGDSFLTTLTGCGMKLTSSTYGRESTMTNRKCWTYKLWSDGTLKSIYGACGNKVITIEAGAPIWSDETWTGVWVAPTDEALPTQAPLTAAPWVCIGATCTLNSAAIPIAGKIVIDLGNVVNPREDVTAAAGIKHYYVSDWVTKITIDAEARTIAQLDNYGLMTAGTLHAFSLAITNGVQVITFAAPKCQRRMINESDQNGRRMAQLELVTCMNTGDDEFTITAA